MEETNTTELCLDYMTSGYVEHGENMEYKCLTIPYRLKVFARVHMGISLCGLVGNVVVVWFLDFHVKKNPFIVYILNLGGANFSLLLLVFLLILAFFSLRAVCSYLYEFISFYTSFLLFVEFLCYVFDLGSLGLLIAISVERCVSVLFPTWYCRHCPKHLSGLVSGMLWALAGFFVSSMHLSFKFAKSYKTIFAGVDIAISIILLSIMLISDLCLFIRLRHGSQKRRPGGLHVAVLLDVIFFFGILFNVAVFLSPPSSGELFPKTTSFLLASLTCSISLFIYFLVGSWRQCRFQGSIKVAFQQVFEERVTNEEENHVPGDTVVETTLEGWAGEEAWRCGASWTGWGWRNRGWWHRPSAGESVAHLPKSKCSCEIPD